MTEKVVYLKGRDSRLAKVIDAVGELRISNYTDSFSFLVHEIVGQMLSASVTKVLLMRLNGLCNNSITPSSISRLTMEDLRGIGLSNSKSSFILNLAQLVQAGRIDFPSLNNLSDEEVTKILMSIKGIGIWTSKMYLLFFLKREDVLPIEDVAFMQSFKWLYGYKNPSAKTVARRCQKWKPYSSIAARYMYVALDSGLTRIPIADFLSK